MSTKYEWFHSLFFNTEEQEDALTDNQSEERWKAVLKDFAEWSGLPFDKLEKEAIFPVFENGCWLKTMSDKGQHDYLMARFFCHVMDHYKIEYELYGPEEDTPRDQCRYISYSNPGIN